MQWICFFFQIPWNHMIPHRRVEHLYNIPFPTWEELSSSLLWLLLLVFGQIIQIILIFPHQTYTVSFAPFRSAFQLDGIFFRFLWPEPKTGCPKSTPVLGRVHITPFTGYSGWWMPWWYLSSFARAYCCLPVTYDPSYPFFFSDQWLFSKLVKY